MILIFSLSVLVAGQLDEHSEKALQQTMELLTNMSDLKKEAAKTPEGQKSMNQLENLGGSEAQNQAMMKLAAEVFSKMVTDANGDIEKLQKMMAEAQKNPEKFADSWNSDQKRRLSEIARNLPSN